MSIFGRISHFHGSAALAKRLILPNHASRRWSSTNTSFAPAAKAPLTTFRIFFAADCRFCAATPRRKTSTFSARSSAASPNRNRAGNAPSARLDGSIGEAVGQLYVEKYFPPEAKARMNDLVENLKAVFRDHLEKVDWMTDATRAKALAKFARFTQKIGYPDKFRDYSSVKIKRDDYLGNVRRAAAFEEHREIARVGKPVDRTEWDMTPPTVNAYFNPLQNEIVFPAGILQPPFFDVTHG